MRDIADIWDNNTFPLVSAAGAMWPLKAGRARAGLRWMAALGAGRRALLVELDPALDDLLPAAAPEPTVYRDYQGQVRPTSFPLTDDFMAGLSTDYDLANAAVHSLTMRPADTGLTVRLTLAAPRRFPTGTGRVVPSGSIKPWPDAPLRFTFGGVTDMSFDADDRIGLTVARRQDGALVTIGCGGNLHASVATV